MDIRYRIHLHCSNGLLSSLLPFHQNHPLRPVPSSTSCTSPSLSFPLTLLHHFSHPSLSLTHTPLLPSSNTTYPPRLALTPVTTQPTHLETP